MVEKFAIKVSNWIIKYNPENQDNYDLFVYAIECMCGFLFSNGSVLILASIIHLPLQAFIWLIFYNSLRFYIGGCHAKSFELCLIGGTLFSMACVIVANYSVKSVFFLQVQIFFSIFITFFIALVMHPNRSLSKKQLIQKRYTGKAIVIIESLVINFIFITFGIELAYSAALGMSAAAFLCLIGKVSILYKKNKE